MTCIHETSSNVTPRANRSAEHPPRLAAAPACTVSSSKWVPLHVKFCENAPRPRGPDQRHTFLFGKHEDLPCRPGAGPLRAAPRRAKRPPTPNHRRTRQPTMQISPQRRDRRARRGRQFRLESLESRALLRDGGGDVQRPVALGPDPAGARGAGHCRGHLPDGEGSRRSSPAVRWRISSPGRSPATDSCPRCRAWSRATSRTLTSSSPRVRER